MTETSSGWKKHGYGLVSRGIDSVGYPDALPLTRAEEEAEAELRQEAGHLAVSAETEEFDKNVSTFVD